MKNFKKGQKIGCDGEGDSIYKIKLLDNKMKCAYLEAFGNTSIDAGWKQFSQIREIRNMKKSKIIRYDVEFN